MLCFALMCVCVAGFVGAVYEEGGSGGARRGRIEGRAGGIEGRAGWVDDEELTLLPKQGQEAL